MSLTVYLGIDVGSVTTKLALVDETGKYVDSVMLKTAGKPVLAVQTGLNKLYEKRITDYEVKGVGTTGSGRALSERMSLKTKLPHTRLLQAPIFPGFKQSWK